MQAAVEELLYQITDEFEMSGKTQLLYPCTQSRAEWLCRKFAEFKKREAAQSVLYLDRSDPAYALGFYHHIVAIRDARGVLFSHERHPRIGPGIAIIIAAFREEAAYFIGPNALGQLARERLAVPKLYPPEYKSRVSQVLIKGLSKTKAVAYPIGYVNPDYFAEGDTDQTPTQLLIDPNEALDPSPETD